MTGYAELVNVKLSKQRHLVQCQVYIIITVIIDGTTLADNSYSFHSESLIHERFIFVKGRVYPKLVCVICPGCFGVSCM